MPWANSSHIGGIQRDIIRVDGLAQLRRALRQLPQIESSRELRDGLKHAADIVADGARQRARPFSNRIADSIRATSGGNTAYVKGGKKALPWYGWADFGSRIPNPNPPIGHGPWYKSGRGPDRGRFIYKSFDANERQVAEAIEEAIQRALNRLFEHDA